jgi:hypothetical protein
MRFDQFKPQEGDLGVHETDFFVVKYLRPNPDMPDKFIGTCIWKEGTGRFDDIPLGIEDGKYTNFRYTKLTPAHPVWSKLFSQTTCYHEPIEVNCGTIIKKFCRLCDQEC